MDYREAAAQYQKTEDENRREEILQSLRKQMSLKEKIYMLSGHPIAQIQRDLIKTGRNYNVHALPGGGFRLCSLPTDREEWLWGNPPVSPPQW